MAEKKKNTFDGIMQDLRKGHYEPVYLLMGDESYYIDQVADYIAENALQPEERDFNQNVVFGADVNAAAIVELARSFPMMAPRQVVIVKEAQALRSWDALEKYLNGTIQTTTVLVVCYKNGCMDRRKSVFKAFEKAGVVMESKKIKEWQLPAFVEKYLMSRNASIDPKSAQMIAESVGSDLSRMVSEMDKLLIDMPDDNRRVTPEMVERKIGVSKDFNVFELRDALVNKNVFKANQIIKYFDENPKAGSIFAFLPMIFRYYQNLMLTYYAPRKDAQGIAEFLELKSQWGAKDYLTGMKNYSGTKVLNIINKIREIDAKSKGLDNPNTSAGELTKELIFFILH